MSIWRPLPSWRQLQLRPFYRSLLRPVYLQHNGKQKSPYCKLFTECASKKNFFNNRSIFGKDTDSDKVESILGHSLICTSCTASIRYKLLTAEKCWIGVGGFINVVRFPGVWTFVNSQVAALCQYTVRHYHVTCSVGRQSFVVNISSLSKSVLYIRAVQYLMTTTNSISQSINQRWPPAIAKSY